MTTPTPRTYPLPFDRHTYPALYDYATKLDKELTEARAERDALKALLPEEGESRTQLRKQTRMWKQQADSDRNATDALLTRLNKAQADLTRLRAVADEMAAALTKIKRMSGEDYDELDPLGAVGGIAESALANYHAATNPASVAANTGVIHRTG